MMLVLKFNQEMDIFYKSLSLYRKAIKQRSKETDFKELGTKTLVCFTSA